MVDVPLAFFFLGQLVKQVHSSIYSSLDELNSMDQELNKSLHFVKVRLIVSVKVTPFYKSKSILQ